MKYKQQRLVLKLKFKIFFLLSLCAQNKTLGNALKDDTSSEQDGDSHSEESVFTAGVKSSLATGVANLPEGMNKV